MIRLYWVIKGILLKNTGGDPGLSSATSVKVGAMFIATVTGQLSVESVQVTMKPPPAP